MVKLLLVLFRFKDYNDFSGFFFPKFVGSVNAGGVPNLALFEGVDNEKVKT